MPALALKALRVLLEYGALLWLAYAVLRLGRSMFRTLHRDIKEAAHLPEAPQGEASFLVIAGEGLTGQRFPVEHELTIGRSADTILYLWTVLYPIITYASIRERMRISQRIWAAAITPI